MCVFLTCPSQLADCINIRYCCCCCCCCCQRLQGAQGLIMYRIQVPPGPPGAHFDDAAAPHRGIESHWFQGQLCEEPYKHADIFAIGAFSSYAECERKLRAKGLVQPDGSLKMELHVMNVQ
jgi:hypothetical protein